MKTYKKRGIVIKLDDNGMPMYSADNRNFFDTEREAKERKQLITAEDFRIQAALMLDSLFSSVSVS